MLSQVVEGKERVVAYASRVLSRTERKYCATRRELLAVVWAAHHFRPYLYGRRFNLRTDHHCLKWLHSFKEPEDGSLVCQNLFYHLQTRHMK